MGPWDTMDTQVLDEEAKEGIAYDAPSADGAGGCGDEHSPVEKSCFFFFFCGTAVEATHKSHD